MRRKLKRFALVVLALGLVGFVGWHSYIEIRLLLAERAVKKLGYPVTLDGWLERWQILPGEANAADLYREAFEAMADEGIDYDLLPVFFWEEELAKDELYPAEVLEEMRRYIALNEEALGLLFQAGAAARSNFLTSREDVYRHLDSLSILSNARNAARLLTVTAILKSEEGDWEGAATATESTIYLAGHLHQTLLDWLTGQAILSMASGNVEWILGRHAIPIDALFSLEAAFERYEEQDSLGATLVADAVVSVQLFTWPFLMIVEESDEELLSSTEKKFLQRAFLLSLHLGGLPRLMRVYSLRDLPVVIPLLDLPVHESLERASEANWSKSGALSRHLDPSSNLAVYVRSRALSFTRVRVVQTALLIESYRAQEGVLPGSLSDLVPAFVGSVPTNPFTGDEVEYELTESGYRVVCREGELDGILFFPFGPKSKSDISFTVERD